MLLSSDYCQPSMPAGHGLKGASFSAATSVLASVAMDDITSASLSLAASIATGRVQVSREVLSSPVPNPALVKSVHFRTKKLKAMGLRLPDHRLT